MCGAQYLRAEQLPPFYLGMSPLYTHLNGDARPPEVGYPQEVLANIGNFQKGLPFACFISRHPVPPEITAV
jgi:hypothetical protein